MGYISSLVISDHNLPSNGCRKMLFGLALSGIDPSIHTSEERFLQSAIWWIHRPSSSRRVEKTVAKDLTWVLDASCTWTRSSTSSLWTHQFEVFTHSFSSFWLLEPKRCVPTNARSTVTLSSLKYWLSQKQWNAADKIRSIRELPCVNVIALLKWLVGSPYRK